MKAISSYGEKIGLAFQIADDILDIEGDSEDHGKRRWRRCPKEENHLSCVQWVSRRPRKSRADGRQAWVR